ncbi:hypothetical protein RJ639_007744 [Escallonia herrerae]|uniref:EamA domain-containing protein n=1 Tax=Escallonia herrerae TaxID=1293975 RepID=A0AA89AY01_9ASTE|nr:hypothetical protein RJ639_007744 [Escallonia herrerae]
MGTKTALPLVGMVVAQFAQVGLMVVSKKAMASGMTNFTFVFYSNSLAALILLPLSFLIHSIVLLYFGFCSFLVQIFGYAGIKYASASLASAMLNLIPGFTFILAVIFRMEKLDFKSSSTLAKSIGTVVLVIGAFIVALYKGPALLAIPNFPHHLLMQPSDWVIGGLFLAIDCAFASMFIIIQVLVLKKYPAELTVMFFYCFVVAILSAAVSFIVERDPSAWSLQPNMRWMALLYSGIFGSAFQVTIGAWCVRRKGPLFVAMFHPLGIVIATFIGVIFLGDGFYLGSLVGSIVIVVGFYSVMWGKSKEGKMVELDVFSGSIMSRLKLGAKNTVRDGGEGDVAGGSDAMHGDGGHGGLHHRVDNLGKHSHGKGVKPVCLCCLYECSCLPHTLPLFIHVSQRQRAATLQLTAPATVLLPWIAIAQNLAFVGLSYSSPIVACGMGNLLPSFSFILAILLRTTKIDWRSSSSQAKCIGTLVSVMGAISLTLYKGPAIKSAPSHQFRLEPRLFVFSSTHEHWILGAILFAAASLTLSIWNIIQVGTIKHYPEVMPALSLYSSVGTIQSALLSVLFERNLSAWRLKLNMELFIIVSTAIFGSVIRSRVHVWCTSMKGPFYVPSFKPLGIPIASICGCLFFADSFHYGSIVGACITGIGYYTVMWGQIREDETSKSSGDVEAPEKEVPLLQEATEV